MTTLKKLEIKKLIKELDFIYSDLDYKNQLINQADTDFLDSVNLFLSSHPELKELFDKKISKNIGSAINTKAENKPIEDKEIEIVDNKDPQLRKLFRKIAKVTHPDVKTDNRLNELYVKSRTYYDSDDITGIYLICDELSIEFEIEESDIQKIFDKIEELKQKITFLESTVTWHWFNETDENVRKKLILSYISKMLHN